MEATKSAIVYLQSYDSMKLHVELMLQLQKMGPTPFIMEII